MTANEVEKLISVIEGNCAEGNWKVIALLLVKSEGI